MPRAAALAGPVYTLGELPSDRVPYRHEVVQAVQAALARRGYHEGPDAPLRLDIALAMSGSGVRSDGDPVTRRSLGALFCRPRYHTLSVAMMDRRDGAILFHRIATDRRCGKDSPERLQSLVEALLTDEG